MDLCKVQEIHLKGKPHLEGEAPMEGEAPSEPLNARSHGSAGASPSKPAMPAHRGKIARYALGDDYHQHLKPRLFKLADLIRQAAPDVQTRVAVDTAPVMEKELAARAGIGWIGKHTCVINESIGSWLLLGEVITTLELPADDPTLDRCGTCTRCIDACPTGAITAPYQLDTRRCVSYLTIEHRGEIAAELQSKLGEWIFGCDICQEVCPWNRKAKVSSETAFKPVAPLDAPMALLDLDDATFRERFRATPIWRARRSGFLRNVALAVARNAS